MLWIGTAVGNRAEAQFLDSAFYENLRFKPNFQLNNRRSLLNGDLVQFWGFKLGLKLNKYHEVGGCFTFMPYKLSFTEKIADSTYNVTARLHFFSVYYEPTVLFRNRWEIDLPFVVGTGIVKANHRGLFSDANSFSENNRVYVFEPSVVAYYRFYKYASVGVGAGYRKTIGPNKDINTSFTAPFFQIKIRLEYKAIGRDYRKYKRAKKAKKATD